MQCSSCGNELPFKTKYCPSCGAAISDNAQENHRAPQQTNEIAASFEAQQPTRAITLKLSSPQELRPTQQRHSSLPAKIQVGRMSIIIGSVALVIILISSGVFIFLKSGTKDATHVGVPLPSTPITNPYPPYTGTLVLNNSMSANNNGYYYWQENIPGDGANFNTCKFVSKAYHVNVTQKQFISCLSTGELSNFTYQVQMTIMKGDGGGIVFRVDPNEHGNFYYLGISITGTYILAVFNNNKYVKVLSHGHCADFHTGLNQTNSIATSVQGANIDIYVNLQHITSAKDNTYSKGQVGLIAVSYEHATDAAFVNAKVWVPTYSLAQINATSTAVYTNIASTFNTLKNPYFPFDGTLALNDPLSDNSRGYLWDIDNKNCQFTTQDYHVTATEPGTYANCNSNATTFSDFAFQVQMTIIKGDRGGLIFRENSLQSFYHFNISKEGAYALDLYSNKGFVKNLINKSSNAFHTGFDQDNLVAVSAKGSTIDLYINLEHVVSLNDATSNTGQIGVTAQDDTNPTEVVFHNAKVWKV